MVLAPAAPALADEAAPARPALALMGTIPIYWGEADGLGELLAPGDTGHWARPVLEQRFRLVPLDYLSADALAPHDTLLLAQPRALSAEENVALDDWVRGGGSLLLFADPMMTGESRFNLGDRRRPQDVVLLSPILTHWDLELVFDDSQAAGLRSLGGNGPQLPVNLAGTWRSENEDCRLAREDVVAICRIGWGTAILVADAAVLDLEGPHEGAESLLLGFSDIMLGGTGENAGTGPAEASNTPENGENPSILDPPPEIADSAGPP